MNARLFCPGTPQVEGGGVWRGFVALLDRPPQPATELAWCKLINVCTGVEISAIPLSRG